MLMCTRKTCWIGVRVKSTYLWWMMMMIFYRYRDLCDSPSIRLWVDMHCTIINIEVQHGVMLMEFLMSDESWFLQCWFAQWQLVNVVLIVYLDTKFCSVYRQSIWIRLYPSTTRRVALSKPPKWQTESGILHHPLCNQKCGELPRVLGRQRVQLLLINCAHMESR